ncbi:MBL fold metallo-hydrolase [Amycolatopsis sp. NPDC058986]|uniref:MBL fold metallo-hydrolase n=1 Tax=unclassified Amycolatopsis TaxID=2618356 RepID=UPI00366CBB6C
MTFAVTFVGGPTAVLELGGARFLTDPTFSGPGVQGGAPGRPLTKTEEPALGASEVGRIDAVLLSHDEHADNLDPAGREFLASVPVTFTTTGGASRLGGVARGLKPWESARVGAVEVVAVPALHGPPGAEPVTGQVIGFLLRGEDLPTVYVSGDNASLDVVREIAGIAGPVEFAVLFGGAARTALFDGAPLTLTSLDAVEATRILAADVVVPLHLRGWEHFSEGPSDMASAFAAAGLADRLRLLDPGERAVW